MVLSTLTLRQASSLVQPKWIIAAECTIASTESKATEMSLADSKSSVTVSTAIPSRDRKSDTDRTAATGWWPCWISVLHRLLPKKPVAPVTSTRMESVETRLVLPNKRGSVPRLRPTDTVESSNNALSYSSSNVEPIGTLSQIIVRT